MEQGHVCDRTGTCRVTMPHFCFSVSQTKLYTHSKCQKVNASESTEKKIKQNTKKKKKTWNFVQYGRSKHLYKCLSDYTGYPRSPTSREILKLYFDTPVSVNNHHIILHFDFRRNEQKL